MIEMENGTTTLGPRWTKELLERCNPKEILVVCAAYGVQAVAARMGYASIEKFCAERAAGQQIKEDSQ